MNMAMGLAFAADLPLMASTFRNQYGHGRLGMGSEPVLSGHDHSGASS